MEIVYVILGILAFASLTFLDLRRLKRYEKRDIQKTNAQKEMLSILEQIRNKNS